MPELKGLFPRCNTNKNCNKKTFYYFRKITCAYISRYQLTNTQNKHWVKVVLLSKYLYVFACLCYIQA